MFLLPTVRHAVVAILADAVDVSLAYSPPCSGRYTGRRGGCFSGLQSAMQWSLHWPTRWMFLWPTVRHAVVAILADAVDELPNTPNLHFKHYPQRYTPLINQLSLRECQGHVWLNWWMLMTIIGLVEKTPTNWHAIFLHQYQNYLNYNYYNYHNFTNYQITITGIFTLFKMNS